MIPRTGQPDQATDRQFWLRRALMALYIIGVTALTAGVAYNAMVRFNFDSTIGTTLDVPVEAAGAIPGSPFSFTIATIGNELVSVSLYESVRTTDPGGDNSTVRWSEERQLPITVDKQSPSGDHQLATVNLTNEAGASPLNVDGRYRLVIDGQRFCLKLPWPQWEPVHEEYTFGTLLSPLPKKIEKTYTTKAGESLDLHWTEPISKISVQTEPEMAVDCVVDDQDNTLTHLLPRDYEQGQAYQMTITSVEAANGMTLQSPRSFVVNTPDPVNILAIDPVDGAWAIDPTDTISITFSEPIKDRDVAEQSITLEPALPGHFQWSADGETVTFIPDSDLPWNTRIHASLQGGPTLRGTSGGFVGDSAAWTFSIRPNQTIDVDLSSQVLTAYEGDEPVMSMLTATGVAGGETPTGTFMVQDKLVTCRMAGQNPSGSYYDIPDVPWVMPFSGDYTIHGAPWRARFGVPGSAGCVSLATWDAQRLWDWAEVGARIVIHY